ncbi:5'/3'-nucleotidase SurE [Halosimplex aquaticum]|uniref:5'/3'-nucleotidase SurE n=1 Tax=Halosimplex aquaticum TaxID=3026162 RepID=A0ABD5Y0P4_9EURY|nr:5'/3'-nucleotidase SurE [Halosimplex aquaticum]
MDGTDGRDASLGGEIEHVLVTNDDGIDAHGLRAVADRLSKAADVTVVAPEGNVSGIGRTRQRRISYEETDTGYAVEGMPADCTAFGLRGLDSTPDAVVSGCNHGPNVGSYVLGQSGTVGAAVEAAWLDVPAIALSAYDPGSLLPRPEDEFCYAGAADVAASLLPALVESHRREGGADLLNVNVPVGRDGAVTDDAPMRATEPHDFYDTTARDDDGAVLFENYYGPQNRLAEGSPAPGELPPSSLPADAEQGALRDGAIAVSPLSVPVAPVDCPVIDSAVEARNERRERSVA